MLQSRALVQGPGPDGLFLSPLRVQCLLIGAERGQESGPVSPSSPRRTSRKGEGKQPPSPQRRQGREGVLVTGQSTENIPDQSGREQSRGRTGLLGFGWSGSASLGLDVGVQLGSPRTPPGNLCLWLSQVGDRAGTQVAEMPPLPPAAPHSRRPVGRHHQNLLQMGKVGLARRNQGHCSERGRPSPVCAAELGSRAVPPP